MHRLSVPRFARYQLLVHLAALLPLAWLLFDAARGHLTANPIQAIEQRTGRYALYLLVASLACTPIQIVSGWKVPARWRRPRGLYAFMYAALHFMTFLGLDYGFDLALIWADVAGKRYIFVGATAFLI
jgi:sulfoxide reductase heme-binding subunit YedZ